MQCVILQQSQETAARHEWICNSLRKFQRFINDFATVSENCNTPPMILQTNINDFARVSGNCKAPSMIVQQSQEIAKQHL